MRYALSNLGCEHAAYQHRVNCTDHREVQIPPVSGAVAGQLLIEPNRLLILLINSGCQFRAMFWGVQLH